MKAFILTICATFLMTGMPCVSPIAQAANRTTVTAEAVTAVPGQIIEYCVSIQGNPGLVSYNLRLRFDTSVFSLVHDETDPSEIICTQGNFSKNGNLICAATNDGCQVLWTHTSNVSADGTLFSLKLRVNEDAPLGSYPIKIENIKRNTVNKNEELVPLSCSNGTVTVRKFQPTVYGESITVKQGETFDYVVSLKDNPGIASYGIQVLFDNKVLSLVEDENAPCVEKNEANFKSGGIVYKRYSNAVEIFWHAVKDTTDEGELFVLHFKVNKDAAVGSYPITIVCVADNIQNAAEQPVNFESENGKINVLPPVAVTIQFTNAKTVAFTAANTDNYYVVAALYDSNGKMLMSKVTYGASSKSFTLTSPQNLSGAVCKVMVLDGVFAPVCSPFLLKQN